MKEFTTEVEVSDGHTCTVYEITTLLTNEQAALADKIYTDGDGRVSHDRAVEAARSTFPSAEKHPTITAAVEWYAEDDQ